MMLNVKKSQDFLRHHIADIIYGANDGIITTFTIVSGVQGAKLAPFIVIILGFVNLVGDGLSMGASSYLSQRLSTATQGYPTNYAKPLAHGLVTFLAFISLGAMPLISYLIPGFTEYQFWISCIMTAITLFCVGSLRVFVAGDGWFKGGLEMLSVGGVVAMIAYSVGHFLGPIFA